MRLSVLLLLSGCAYISGPPDYSNVPSEADADTDTDTDSDTDTDTDVDAAPPELEILDLTLDIQGIEVQFRGTEGDGSLTGGAMLIDFADIPDRELAIPQDIIEWNEGATSTMHIPVIWPCTGGSYSFTLQLEDADGVTSARASRSFTIASGGLYTGDQLVTAGTIEPPFVFCGDLPNAGDNFDAVKFNIAAQDAGTHTVEASWDAPTADVDLRLNDWNGGSPVMLVGDLQPGAVQPASVTFDLVGGMDYSVQITHFEGPELIWKGFIAPQ